MSLQPWIRLRVGLHEAPRLICMSKSLRENPRFMSWVAGPIDPLPLRLLVCGIMLRIWGIARDHGDFQGEDLIMAGLDLGDLDGLAGAPGIGAAMAEVGWAFKRIDPPAVVLPNFSEHNSAKTPAERQRLFRWRQSRGLSATKVEKSREEKDIASEADACAAGSKASPSAPAAAIDAVVMTFPTTKAAKGKYKGLDQWPLTASKLAEYRQSFPNVDLDTELLKARQWLVDNNRKTFTGMPAYLGRWLGKCQDRGGPAGGRVGGGRQSAADFARQQARSLFDDTGTLHAGDPNDE